MDSFQLVYSLVFIMVGKFVWNKAIKLTTFSLILFCSIGIACTGKTYLSKPKRYQLWIKIQICFYPNYVEFSNKWFIIVSRRKQEMRVELIDTDS